MRNASSSPLSENSTNKRKLFNPNESIAVEAETITNTSTGMELRSVRVFSLHTVYSLSLLSL
jgi:hypothetical protein